MESERHPTSHHHQKPTPTSGSKENLSVYGLFQHLARSSQGKYRLRQYFLRPSLDKDLIQERLDAISVLVRPENQYILEAVMKALKAVKNMRAVIINLQKGLGSTADISGGIRRSIWRNLSQVKA